MSEIELPEDKSKSRLPKPQAQVVDEEFVTAAERFTAFREQHPNGYVEATIDRVIEHPDGHVTYVMQAAAYRVRPGFGFVERPDATAWAQGSTKSDNAIVAASPLESADTIARSRAIRNLGILQQVGDTEAIKPAPVAPTLDISPVAVAREAAKMSQKQLAEAMRSAGISWSQAVVSKVERGTRALRDDEAAALIELIGFEASS